MGFGTGTLAGSQPVDTTAQLADSTSQIKVGVFTGFRLKTPIFAQRGGLDLMAEWDGAGINFGLRIPITPDYRIQIGAIHIDKLPQFGSQGNKEVLTFDAPAIARVDSSRARDNPAATRRAVPVLRWLDSCSVIFADLSGWPNRAFPAC